MSQSIKNWNEDDRPREKLLQKGAHVLSDAELLAILISSGTREKTALDLAKEILHLAENQLTDLGKLQVAQFTQVKGIGIARAITIAAALELGRRRRSETITARQALTTSNLVAEQLFPLLQDLPHEVMQVLYLNNKLHIIRKEQIAQGGLEATLVDIRIILKNALLQGSSKVIISHNHPSGNVQPSNADKLLTQKLKDAAKLMDIQLIDHLIIGGNNYFSFADEGML